MKKQCGATAVEFVLTMIIFLSIGGWIANIVKLVGSSFDPLTGMVVLRGIGVFMPLLGGLLGFI